MQKALHLQLVVTEGFQPQKLNSSFTAVCILVDPVGPPVFEGPFVSNVPVVMIWRCFHTRFRDNKVSNGDSGFGRGCYRMLISFLI